MVLMMCTKEMFCDLLIGGVLLTGELCRASSQQAVLPSEGYSAFAKFSYNTKRGQMLFCLIFYLTFYFPKNVNCTLLFHPSFRGFPTQLLLTSCLIHFISLWHKIGLFPALRNHSPLWFFFWAYSMNSFLNTFALYNSTPKPDKTYLFPKN